MEELNQDGNQEPNQGPKPKTQTKVITGRVFQMK